MAIYKNPADTLRLCGHLRKGSVSGQFLPENAAAKQWADTVGAVREIVLEGSPASPIMWMNMRAKTLVFLARLVTASTLPK
jgi:hypothetical protein